MLAEAALRSHPRPLGDLLRGEWWIDDSGSTTFADGDIGDYNHERYALEVAIGIDLDDVDNAELLEAVVDRRFTPEVLEALEEAGANMKFVRWCRDDGACDARDYALEHMGWIRVKGDNFEVWKLDDSALDRIQNADIWEEAEGTLGTDDEVFIEEHSTKTLLRVPVSALFDAKDLRQLRIKLRQHESGSQRAFPFEGIRRRLRHAR